MREIKFRAWDKKKKCVIPIHEINWNKISSRVEFVRGYDNEEGGAWDCHGGNNHFAHGDRFEFMQYIGLKDKTGKEVYEGDIIVCGYDTGKSYNRYIIEFSDSAHAYLARQVGCTSYIGSGYWGNTMLVIGNIHENPELLEVTRCEK